MPQSIGTQSFSAAARALAFAHAAPRRFAVRLARWRRFRLGSSATATSSSLSSTLAFRAGLTAAPALHAAGTARGRAPGAGGARRAGLVWFRADLRLHDNEALARANAECSSIVPVYCFDPRDYGRSPQGYDRTGPYRATFLIQAITDLRNRLRAAGSELVVRVGRPEEVLPEIARRIGAAALYCHSEVTYEESQVESRVNEAMSAVGAKFQAFWTNTLHHPEDLPFSLTNMPQNFDRFKSAITAVNARTALSTPERLKGAPVGSNTVLEAGDIPSLKDLGLAPLSRSSSASMLGSASSPQASPAQTPTSHSSNEDACAVLGCGLGGETEAIRQLRRFIDSAVRCGGGQKGEATSRTGAAHSTSFSSNVAPWLATGCLSPRTMLEETVKALGEGCGAQGIVASKSGSTLQWVHFELLWRDFFRLLTRRHSEVVLPRAREAVMSGEGGAGAVAGAAAFSTA